jgi:hypothetical protein
MEIRGMSKRYWWEDQKERPLGRLGHRWGVFERELGAVWIGLICLRVGTSGGFL